MPEQKPLHPNLQQAIEEAVRRGLVHQLPEMYRESSRSNPSIIEPDWRIWGNRHYPKICNSDFSQPQIDIWDWFDTLQPGVRPKPRIMPISRGGGKSTTCELNVVRLGCKMTRKFALWVNSIQLQADYHVQAIGTRAF
jgi:hypothetical protein